DIDFFPTRRSSDLELLIRQAGNEIDIDVVESVFPERLDIAENVSGIVEAARIFQVLIVKRLRPEADAIDAGTGIAFELSLVERAGIRFEADFFGSFRKSRENFLNPHTVND